ncbi:MAG TPA: protein kinase [Candidatus Polarisedimenticolia bacterium]|jgi:Tol biopolymer transport system component|nr:protein kinase [Candidatus Polarisedimenticolia bacterium]
MTLLAGTRLGPYEIVGPLGAGGMGEVYRAKDTRLGREVAIKVLPQHLTDSPEVRARFEREARTVSSLNHPHICTLHDVGQEGTTDYLVMELVDGETLAARLERGPLAVPEVLRLGIQIADALDRAHRAGVVHRDLKPANVMLTRSGAKLMDFGLARATGMAGPAGGSGLTRTAMAPSPTMAQPLTSEGSLVGTFQYMSPEQLEGKEADARSDLWGLGCVLYEMATGRKAFAGKSQASLIGSIMNVEPPPIAEIAPLAPPTLERLVRACLTKDPDERIQTAHDVRLQLEWIRDAGSQAGVAAPIAARRRSREPIAWAMAAAGLAAAGMLLYLRLTAPHREESFQASILPPPDTHFIHYSSVISISPDGRNVVFIAAGETGNHLWLRPLGSDAARLLPEGNLGGAMFWSPDNRYFGYATLGGKLRKVAVGGGAPTTICNLKWARGADWGTQGRIIFAPAPEGPLFSVPAAGGEPSPVTALDAARHQTSHRFPSFLPDGEHFIFAALPGGPGGLDLFVASLKSKTVKKVMMADSAAVYAEPGYLIFAREGKILAQPFDSQRLEPSGEAVVIADAPPPSELDAEPVASVSDNGRLVFLRGRVPSTRLEWIDRSGAARGTIPLPAGPWKMFALSPDRRMAALMNGTDLWLVDLLRSIPTRFAPTFSKEANVVWFDDSRRIAFSSNRSGRAEIYLGSADGTGEPEMVPTTDAQFKTVWDVSRDGRRLVFGMLGNNTSWDLWTLPLEKGGKPQPYQAGPGQESHARISPDGRWLAYDSDESGRLEVYVQSFPVPERKTRISVDGGDTPGWTMAGKELLYAKEDTVMSVPIGQGAALEPGVPRPLLTLPEGTTGVAATADGERFLVTAGPDAQRDIRVILNWTTLLKQ